MDALPAGDHQVVETLRRACADRDRALLAGIMHPRVTLVVDGGGTISTAEPSTVGADQATSRLLHILEKHFVSTIIVHDVNGAPGLLFRADDQVVGIVGAQVQQGRTTALFVVVSTAKLIGWNHPDGGDVTGDAGVLS